MDNVYLCGLVRQCLYTGTHLAKDMWWLYAHRHIINHALLILGETTIFLKTSLFLSIFPWFHALFVAKLLKIFSRPCPLPLIALHRQPSRKRLATSTLHPAAPIPHIPCSHCLFSEGTWASLSTRMHSEDMIWDPFPKLRITQHKGNFVFLWVEELISIYIKHWGGRLRYLIPLLIQVNEEGREDRQRTRSGVLLTEQIWGTGGRAVIAVGDWRSSSERPLSRKEYNFSF